MGEFRGEVVNVPKLQAPGFIKAQTKIEIFHKEFPDISSCKAIYLEAKANAEYDGYRFAFGTKRSGCAFFTAGFKSHFSVPVSKEIGRIEIPFNLFSDCTSDSTGKQTKTCSTHPEVCPDAQTLRNVRTIALWAEGAAGTVSLDVKSIGATGCSRSVPDQQIEILESASAVIQNENNWVGDLIWSLFAQTSGEIAMFKENLLESFNRMLGIQKIKMFGIYI